MDNVAWLEGMFITPQHFQQHDRYLHEKIRGCLRQICGFTQGVSQLEIDTSALKGGKIVITQAAGIFSDGYQFELKQDLVLQVPTNSTGKRICLGIPMYRSGQVNTTDVSDGSGARFQQSERRYRIRQQEVLDDTSEDNDPVNVATLHPNIVLQVEREGLDSWLLMPIGRIQEVRPDGEVVLAKNFIPTCLNIRASDYLYNGIRELTALMTRRARGISQRLATESRGVTFQVQMRDYLWLQVLNRWLPWSGAVLDDPGYGPRRLYRELSMLAGELRTMEALPAEEVQPYQPDNVEAIFPPLFAELRHRLGVRHEDAVVERHWDDKQFAESRIFKMEWSNAEELQGSRVILAVTSSIGSVSLNKHFVRSGKLAGRQRMKELVCNALPGVPLKPLAMPPLELKVSPDTAWFEVDTRHALWQEMLQAMEPLLLHIDERIPDVAVRLFVIR
ncbi:type VI secretion system baseplate subunit TssK [Endozoicomonadaceae bacterium StTr2]